MRKFVHIYILFLFIFLFNSCKNMNNDNRTFSNNIEKCIDDYITKWDYKSGLEVSVYGKKRNLNFNYKGGYSSISNKVHVNEDNTFILFSITKSMTAAVILDLVNDGKISLNNTVEDFFHGLNPIYFNNDATIEELLSHRSGIQDYTDNAALFYNNPFIYNKNWDPFKILDYINLPAANRGTFIYSSANYILLGMIIEKITGQRLSEIFQEKIFTPCNIDLALYPQKGIYLEKIVHPHVYPNTFMGLYGDGKTPIDISNQIKNINELLIKCSWAAGGVIGKAEDTALWGYELLSENGIVETSIRNCILDSVSKFSNDASLSDAYGFGIRKIIYSNYELIGSYGRSIGSENLMFYNKEKDVCIVILSASNTKADGTPNIDELMFSIFDSIDEKL